MIYFRHLELSNLVQPNSFILGLSRKRQCLGAVAWFDS